MSQSFDLKNPYLWRRFEGWAYRGHVDAYISRMQSDGYTERHIYRTTRIVGDYARWLIDEHRDGSDVHEETAERYLGQRAQRIKWLYGSRAALARLLSILRGSGVIAPAVRVFTPHDRLLEAFALHLKVRRGLSAASIKSNVWFARRFLVEIWQGDDDALRQLQRADVIGYVERHAHDGSPATARLMCNRVRNFLRYLRVEGVVEDDLADSVPLIRGWKLTTLPTFLSPSQLELVFEHCDRSTVAGRRDYAVLMLLAKLGLRANEVARLSLDDIDWRSGLFQVQGKGGRRATMPLTPEVGGAIAAYLQDGRPASRHREVFLRIETPCTPFPSAAAVILLARRALKRAGITGLAHRGSHVFRHTVATHMIRSGASLVEISQLLRHQNPDTSRIYAKVDLPSLQALGVAWPGGAP